MLRPLRILTEGQTSAERVDRQAHQNADVSTVIGRVIRHLVARVFPCTDGFNSEIGMVARELEKEVGLMILLLYKYIY